MRTPYGTVDYAPSGVWQPNLFREYPPSQIPSMSANAKVVRVFHEAPVWPPTQEEDAAGGGFGRLRREEDCSHF